MQKNHLFLDYINKIKCLDFGNLRLPIKMTYKFEL